MSEPNQNSKIVFLSGKKVNLRPGSKTDVPLLAKWINDPEVREFVSAVFPQTEKQEEEWYNRLGSDNKNIVFVIETKEGKPIGVMGIHKINWVHRHCDTGAIIGEKEYWGKGFGTDAKMHLLKYIFEVLNLYKVCSGVIEFNERSLNYSLHCGYQIEGRRRRHIFRKGRYWDLIELGLFYEEWEPKWKEFENRMV